MKNIYKIVFALLIVGALGLTASSASAASYGVSVSVGSGSFGYVPYSFNDCFGGGCGGYNYPGYNYSLGYNYGANWYGARHNASFWNSGAKFNLPALPKPANRQPVTISGLGFNAQPGSNQSGVPATSQVPVCPFGSTWNGAACATISVACPAGQAYSYTMNLCLPARY
jgi:hypothetical protein